MDESDLVHVISDSPKGTTQENQEKNVVKPCKTIRNHDSCSRCLPVFPLQSLGQQNQVLNTTSELPLVQPQEVENRRGKKGG